VDHFAGEKDSRLTIVDGCQPVESVYVNLRTAVMPNIRQEIVEVTQSEVDRLYNTDSSSVARMVVKSIGSGGRPICIDHIRPAAARGQIFDFAVYLHLKFIQLRLFSLSFFHMEVAHTYSNHIYLVQILHISSLVQLIPYCQLYIHTVIVDRSYFFIFKILIVLCKKRSSYIT
jgi:hypothetical protein